MPFWLHVSRHFVLRQGGKEVSAAGPRLKSYAIEVRGWVHYCFLAKSLCLPFGLCDASPEYQVEWEDDLVDYHPLQDTGRAVSAAAEAEPKIHRFYARRPLASFVVFL